MNLQLEDNDAQLFAPAILAMLDFDEASWSMGLKEEVLVVACESKPLMLRRHTTEAEPQQNKRKRAATPRLQNKAKIELLRREIESLEAELEDLQRSKRMAGILTTTYTDSRAEPAWKGIASRQNRERERAMRCNERLRRRLVEQQMLTVSLSGVLSEIDELTTTKMHLVCPD